MADPKPELQACSVRVDTESIFPLIVWNEEALGGVRIDTLGVSSKLRLSLRLSAVIHSSYASLTISSGLNIQKLSYMALKKLQRKSQWLTPKCQCWLFSLADLLFRFRDFRIASLSPSDGEVPLARSGLVAHNNSKHRGSDNPSLQNLRASTSTSTSTTMPLTHSKKVNCFLFLSCS